jgi:hypothetical protein
MWRIGFALCVAVALLSFAVMFHSSLRQADPDQVTDVDVPFVNSNSQSNIEVILARAIDQAHPTGYPEGFPWKFSKGSSELARALVSQMKEYPAQYKASEHLRGTDRV